MADDNTAQMKKIPLRGEKGKGLYALVDADDFNMVSNYKWSLRAGYVAAYIPGSGKHMSLHRMIMNPPRDMVMDHINFDKLDNRKCNLRVCTRSNNSIHRKPYGSKRFKGIHFDKTRKKWNVSLRCRNSFVWIGRFNDPMSAARAYDEKAKQLHGEFAYLNFNK